MTSAQVDCFSARLNLELAALPWNERNDLLIRIGRMELRMRSDGQERPIWRGPTSEDRLLGADVVFQTDRGEQRGRVVCFGVMNMGVEYERSVVVRVPSSGTQHEVPGSAARLASPDDSERIVNEIHMAERLVEAAQRVDPGPTPVPTPQRKRGQRDPQFVESMLELARAHRNVRAVEDGPVNHKVVGVAVGRRIYVFKSQLRIDLSGFTLVHPAVRAISDDEARIMHLGRVRGQLLFDDRNLATEAFEAALEELKT